MIEFGRNIVNDFDAATSREWLITNGIGGYASGTISGVLTRRYHGLLIAAQKPPLERVLLATKLDEIVYYQDQEYELGANHWEDGSISPAGYQYIESFFLEGTIPSWIFNFDGARLKKQIWMQPEKNTTYVRYELAESKSALNLKMRAIANSRDHHGRSLPEEAALSVSNSEHGLEISSSSHEGTRAFILSKDCVVEKMVQWQCYYLGEENYRGLDPTDWNIHCGDFMVELRPGESAAVVITTDLAPDLNGNSALRDRKVYEKKLLAALENDRATDLEKQLALAADQFIVSRVSLDDPSGKSVIAGYPWFSDWGRDTMIALPGLTLATGRTEIARQILNTFSLAVNQGMLPNRFPEIGEDPEYNTVDATLWYFEAARAYIHQTEDMLFLKQLFPLLQEIVDWHIKGTRYNIKMDEMDGLLYAGADDVQLTWMDVKIGDWVATPRTGKSVEINALWYNALKIMADFSGRLGEPAEKYLTLAERVRGNFDKFWNREAGMCFDVIDGPKGNDPSLRPNQIFAVSLPHSPLNESKQRVVIDVCANKLLTPCGLRSLSPDDEDYVGIYGGDQNKRDRSYHQGTAWGWLIGPFIKAHLRVYNDPVKAQEFLQPLIDQVYTHGVGSISEIFDGDPPHTPRGCIAQAWSVAQLISALYATK